MVLHVVKSKIYSGAENVICQIINGMPEEDFIYMSPRGPIEDKLESLGLSYCYRGIEKLNIEEIKKAVEELKPTVVHAHDFTASVLCAFALKDSVPVISHLHNNPPWIQKLNARTIAYYSASKYFKHIFVVSDAVRKEFFFSSKIACPMTVVGNPFSVEGVVSQAEDAPSSDILFVGRLTEQKDPVRILSIANKLSQDSEFISKYGKCLTRIVGDGEMMADCRSYAKAHKLEENGIVAFEGFRKDPFSFFKHAKLVIMPSKWEGFGLVALEAMALGVPVVCSGEGGLKTIVSSECGYVCKTDEEYLASIKELLLNEDVRKAKSIKAVEKANSYSNIKEYTKRLGVVYKTVAYKKCNVLHVFKSKIYSGAENVVCQIMSALDDKENFTYMAPYGPIVDKLNSIDLIENYYGINNLNSKEVRKAVERLKPDVVHAHDFTASVLCGFALKDRVPIISHLHQNPPWLKTINTRTLSYFAATKWIKKILTVSDSVNNDFVFRNSKRVDMEVVGNPFSINNVIDKASSPCEVESDLIFVGRLSEAKNPIGALRVANALKNKFSFKMVVIGDGELNRECLEYIEKNELESFVEMLGYQDNPYSYIKNSKVVVMPSLWEGFGLVALESMALGKPIVCSGAGGLSSIVNEQCGSICKNIEEYVESIELLLGDSSVYEAKSEAAVERAKEYDNIGEYAKHIEAIYNELK